MNPPGDFKRLGRRFFSRDPRVVAKALIGHGIIRRWDDGWVGGVIVETEAYLSAEDPASHSRSGPTRRCQSMFATAGTLYVYAIHAKYCLNVVTEKSGMGSAVLIRALQPIWGSNVMQRLRGQQDVYRLTRGPAMICQALSITTQQDGIDLIDSKEIFLVRRSKPAGVVGTSSRIGISTGQELPYRYYQHGSRFVSRP